MEHLLLQVKQRNYGGADKALSSSLSAVNSFATNKAEADGVPGSVWGQRDDANICIYLKAVCELGSLD